MRSSLALILFASACATSNAGKVCTPVSSWASPAYRCVAAGEPAAAPAPAEPAPTPEPEAPKPRVQVTGERIELKEKVEFGTDSAVVLDQSKPLLDEVVTVMKAHPEIKKIRVEGHTDSQGSHDHNVKLSDDRAASVRKYLEDHGIDAKRMVSKGFGPDKPIADNKTDAGRAENRRVEIHILEKK